MFRQSERFRSHFGYDDPTIFTYSIPTSGKEPEYASRISLDTKPLWSNIRSLGNGSWRILSRDESQIPFDQTGKKTMDFGTYPKN